MPNLQRKSEIRVVKATAQAVPAIPDFQPEVDGRDQVSGRASKALSDPGLALPGILIDPEDRRSKTQLLVRRALRPRGAIQHYGVLQISRLVREISLNVHLINGNHVRLVRQSVASRRGLAEASSSQPLPDIGPFEDFTARHSGALEALVNDENATKLLKRLRELFGQLRKLLANYNKFQLKNCDLQIARIKAQVALRPFQYAPLPKFDDGLERLRHQPELGDDKFFIIPDESHEDDRSRLETFSAGWIDRMGLPPLLHDSERDAYLTVYLNRASEFCPEAEFRLLLVKLLADLEFLDRRFEAIERHLLRLDDVDHMDLEALDFPDLMEILAAAYAETEATVVEITSRRRLIASSIEEIHGLLAQDQQHAERLEIADLAHKKAVLSAFQKGIYD